MKPGVSAGGKPRGDRFKAIAADRAAMHAGMVRAADLPAPNTPAAAAKAKVVPANVPLAESPNEKARARVTLDTKSVRDVRVMSPAASTVVRTRPYLTPELMAAWRVRYLPRGTGEDRAGGTTRGRIVFPMHDAGRSRSTRTLLGPIRTTPGEPWWPAL